MRANRLTGLRVELEKWYGEGRSGYEISDMLAGRGVDITARSVTRQLRRWGVAVKGTGRHANALDMFKEIATEEDAYWLGFLMGDGFVSKNGNYITLGIIDGEHVEKMKQYFGIPAEIVRHKGRKENQRDMYHIGIYSQRSVANAAKWGLVYDKNKRTVPVLPEKLMCHFWRGLWDADGHVSNGNIALTCKKVFLDAFRKWLNIAGEHEDGYCGGLYQAGENTWRLHYCSAYARYVLETLYKNCKVALQRKREVARLVIKGSFCSTEKSEKLYKSILAGERNFHEKELIAV